MYPKFHQSKATYIMTTSSSKQIKITDQDHDNQKWYIMITVAMSIFIETIDYSIVNMALPTLVRELQTDFTTVQWLVLGVLLTQTTLMLMIGRLSDMIGKKPIYIAGLIVFTLGTILCGLASNITWLIVFRVVQAIGGAMFISLVFALVTEAFPPTERGKGIGLISTTVSGGIIIGPLVGGFILESFSWREIFFVTPPIALIGLFLALRFIPATKTPSEQQFDYGGAITFFITLLTLLLALNLGQRGGFSQPYILLMFACAGISLIMFTFIEWHTDQPLLALRLFLSLRFSLNIISRILSFLAISGVILMMPFYLDTMLGYTPRQVGLLLITMPVCMGISAPISGMLADRFGTPWLMVGGLSLVISGCLTLSSLTVDINAIGYIIRLMPFAIGIGLFQAANNTAIMASIPRKNAGVASSLISITRTLGGTTGIAVISAIWTSRVLYHAGPEFVDDVINAPTIAQVAGLQDMFWVIMVGMSCVMVLNLWGNLRKQAATVQKEETLRPNRPTNRVF